MESRSARCRLCKGETRLRADRGDVALFMCCDCDFVSGDPRDGVSISERYENYYHAPAPPAPISRYLQWLQKAEAVVGRGHVLEVGAGSGAFVEAALGRGWKVDANEVSDSGLRMLRRTAATVFAGDLISAHYPDAQFDLVVSLEVIEHLQAPLDVVREMWRVTRPGGLLLLTTPNFDGLSRRYLGIGWRVIGPEHLGYFTAPTLVRLLRDAGYRSVCVRSRSLDVLSWRRCDTSRITKFDPYASAHLREAVENSKGLLFAKAILNAALRITGLGDSLLAWAQR